jgi:rhodanese-related sulfurtransferase
MAGALTRYAWAVLRRIVNLPFAVASKAARAYQGVQDARLKREHHVADDPGAVPLFREAAAEVGEGDAASAPVMSADQVREAIARGPVAFVDVRPRTRFDAAHIDGATHMPMSEVGVRVSELPGGIPVVAYCDDGRDSARAVAFFRARGMEDTFVLAGGMAAWGSRREIDA